MKVYIASDHGGFTVKEKIREIFEQKYPQTELVDLGPFKYDPNDDYPDYAFKVAEKVSKNEEKDLGILICRSGNGMAIAANKVKNIRAALCFTPKHAEKAREDDFANILCLDSEYSDTPTQLEIVDKFINTEWAGWDTRHGRRVKKIRNYELGANR